MAKVQKHEEKEIMEEIQASFQKTDITDTFILIWDSNF